MASMSECMRWAELYAIIQSGHNASPVLTTIHTLAASTKLATARTLGAPLETCGGHCGYGFTRPNLLL
jgi:hypothetical protein